MSTKSHINTVSNAANAVIGLAVGSTILVWVGMNQTQQPQWGEIQRAVPTEGKAGGLVDAHIHSIRIIRKQGEKDVQGTLDEYLEMAMKRMVYRCNGKEARITSMHRDTPITGPDGYTAKNSIHLQKHIIQIAGISIAIPSAVDFSIVYDPSTPLQSRCNPVQQAQVALQEWVKQGGVGCYRNHPHITHLDRGAPRTWGVCREVHNQMSQSAGNTR